MKKARTRTEKGRSQPAAPEPRALKPWHYGLALAAAFLALLIVYAPALKGSFVFDDLYLPFTGQEFANAPLVRWVGGLRPLLMFSYWVNYQLSGLETFSYHQVNLLFHLVTGALCFLIVRKFLERAGESGWKRDGLAAFAAGLFLFHPLQTEAVAYVASRSDALSVMFLYAALALFLYRRSEAISWLEALGVVALFAAAASTKEHTAVFPALLLLTDYYWNPGFSLRGIRRNWRLYAILAVAGAAAARMVWNVLRSADTAGFSIKTFTWVQYFYTQCRVIWLYLRMFVLPYGQNADPDFPVSHTLVEHGAVVALAALILAVAAAIYYRRRFPLASYGFLAFLLLLAPTSSFVPIADVVAERRMYLPFVGLLLVLVEFLRRWKVKPGRLAAALAGVLVVMAGLTFNRTAVWSSPMALWTDAVSKSPHKPRPQIQLGFLYFTQGRCDVALPYFETAARYGPPRYDLLVDWGMDYECLGRQDDAIKKLRQAAEFRPGADSYSTLAWACVKAGRLEEARQALDTAQHLDAAYDMAYAFRGDLDLAGGDPAAAEKEYRHALSLNPANETAQEGLARLGQAGPPPR